MGFDTIEINLVVNIDIPEIVFTVCIINIVTFLILCPDLSVFPAKWNISLSLLSLIQIVFPTFFTTLSSFYCCPLGGLYGWFFLPRPSVRSLKWPSGRNPHKWRMDVNMKKTLANISWELHMDLFEYCPSNWEVTKT